MNNQRLHGSITTGLLKPITAALSIVALLAGCGSVEAKDTVTEATSADKVVSVNVTEPSNGLLPSDTSDMSGWKIVSQLYDGLVTFDAEGNETLVEAESITPNDDASEYTIVLKPNLTFSNGEKITADTYAKSWSFAANAANGQVGASIFEDIQGYDDLQDAEGSKTAQLSGLTVVDGTTLKVRLKASNSAFLYKIGDIAFLPMPSEVIKNPKEYGQKPIGNGPYKLKAYKSGEEIILEKDDSYKGPRKVKNAGIDFKVYQSLDAAYSDLLAGNLDVLDSIPTSALKTYQNEKNITAVSKPGPSFSAFTISQNLKHFQGEEGRYRRQAIAHAIDRENIADAIFSGTVTPATDFLAPVIKGYDTDLDADDVLTYDEAKAKELWAKADAISPWSGTFRIAYSADGTDKEWVEAAANSIRNALGIDGNESLAAFARNQRALHGAGRAGRIRQIEDRRAGKIAVKALKRRLKIMRRAAAGARQLAVLFIIIEHLRRGERAVVIGFSAEGDMHRHDHNAVFLRHFGRDIAAGFGNKDHFAHGNNSSFFQIKR